MNGLSDEARAFAADLLPLLSRADAPLPELFHAVLLEAEQDPEYDYDGTTEYTPEGVRQTADGPDLFTIAVDDDLSQELTSDPDAVDKSRAALRLRFDGVEMRSD
ncbi:hypothetical protein RBH20_19740 [Haloarcula sp. H-GB4]|uniref:hypothetical protein n=1 Tax=Haloarcula sp. H-GB4 TaxID=3069755 RepID=UPI0027AE1EDA|nr:hypothetical protein [Haloarcula sp. H-GB4]MDQ2074763.1 hypothetical protein [Haloarcula sp. H-GB4]